MENNKRQECVTRIISGATFFDFQGKPYIIKEPDILDKTFAEKIYQDSIKKGEELGILTEKEILEIVSALGLWSKADEKRLKEMPKLLEDAKVKLYMAYAAYQKRGPIRKHITKVKKEFEELLIKKNYFRNEGLEGAAELLKTRYLVCSNITDLDGNRLWKYGEFFEQSHKFINLILKKYIEFQVTEKEVRELSRNDPWRSLWSAGKTESGVFGMPSSKLTADQKHIIIWSRIYDSVYESQECPNEEVIEDDDMIDGWLTLQNRKREEDKKNSQSERSDAKGDEVYIVADTQSDAQRIYGMNSPDGRGLIKTRQKQIEGDVDGEGISAENTLDAQMELRRIALEQFKSKR
tara:strand:+ start:1475 stop:2524 length:1050 start_codon:yes stop_codon:yes gene_type:complete